LRIFCLLDFLDSIWSD